MLPFVASAHENCGRTGIFDAHGAHTYGEILEASGRVATELLMGREDVREERIAFYAPPGVGWVAMQWGIWRAGGIAVPLPMNATKPELEYILEDTGASAVLLGEGGGSPVGAVAVARNVRVVGYEQLAGAGDGGVGALPDVGMDRRAMILYTSGTTSRAKGVVTTHANIAAQVGSLVEAWEWSAEDSVVLCLPLHHIHGIINIVSCALWSGAACHMLPRFDANGVWDLIASEKLTLFMAVPTIYVRLIAVWEWVTAERRAELSEACRKLRLMVCGSAALPVSTLHRWEEISGHTLLERYGMTEIGMALSNPLHGRRIPGSVGMPLPNVEARLVGDNGQPQPEGTPGEIEIRGPGVFKEYWGKPEATLEAFADGWFRTGDTAVIENGAWRILGRTSIDILKSGGHKLSALEIEEALRAHPAIAECAVVGVPDAEWGERVGAALVLHPSAELDLATLRAWGREFLASHKLPSRLLIVDALPRNAMGKVVKSAVTAMFQSQTGSNE